MTVEIEWLSKCIADPRSQRRSIGRLIETFLNDGEFVAAQTSNHVYISDAVAQPIGHAHKQFVTGWMTEGLIDLLHIIKVEIKDGEPLSALDTFEFLLKLLAKHLAIRQTGQRINACRMRDSALRPALLR